MKTTYIQRRINYLLFSLAFKLMGVVILSLERVFKALVSGGLSETDARVNLYLALKGPKKAGT